MDDTQMDPAGDPAGDAAGGAAGGSKFKCKCAMEFDSEEALNKHIEEAKAAGGEETLHGKWEAAPDTGTPGPDQMPGGDAGTTP